LNKEEAIKILETNITRKLLKQWFLFDFWLAIFPFIVLNLGFYLIPTGNITLGLPAPILKPENVLPPIFTGSITALSIIIGFFSVSAYNFHQRYQTMIEFCDELELDAKSLYSDTTRKKQSIEEEIQKQNFSPQEKAELDDKMKELNIAISRTENTLEESKVLADAFSHMQEHIGHFIIIFFIIGFLMLFFLVFSLILTLASSAFDFYFIVFDMFCLTTIFTGLGLFMAEFMTYRIHKDRYKKGKKFSLRSLFPEINS
jgi:hypothetical protein